MAKKYENLLLEVMSYCQFPNYPTGCEIVSLYILLKYYGIDVTLDDLISHINRGSMPHFQDFAYYGSNPEKYFVGDPTTKCSYGVYNDPICELANLYKDGAISKKNFPVSQIIQLLDEKRPVIAWVTIHLKDPFISATWFDLEDGSKIEWYSGEHAVVICGYTNNAFIVSDPYTGDIRYLDYEEFVPVYKKLGKRVVYY